MSTEKLGVPKQENDHFGQNCNKIRLGLCQQNLVALQKSFNHFEPQFPQRAGAQALVALCCQWFWTAGKDGSAGISPQNFISPCVVQRLTTWKTVPVREKLERSLNRKLGRI